MKILKSGIEMEPEELDKVRGGLCACGCAIGVSGLNMSVVMQEGGDCGCGCICSGPYATQEYVADQNYQFYGAYVQLHPPF